MRLRALRRPDRPPAIKKSWMRPPPCLPDRRRSRPFRGQVLAALGKLDDPRVGTVVLDAYPALEPDLQPRAIELLTQRPGVGQGTAPGDRGQEDPGARR